MTLRDTIRSILQHILDWAKANRGYYGSLKSHYENKLDEERKIAAFKKKIEAQIKAEKEATGDYEAFKEQ